MKHLIITCLLFLSSSAFFEVWPQNGTSKNEEIARIKLEGDKYLYSETTNADQKEAKINAVMLLKATIEEWLRNHDPFPDNYEEILDKTEKKFMFIQASRGNYYRVLAYVEKQDITSLLEGKKENLSQIQGKDREEVVEYTPELAAVPTTALLDSLKVDLDEIEREIVNMKRMDKVIPYLEKLAEKKDIADHGRMADLPESGDYNLIIYDREGSVLAYLRHKKFSTINLITGRPDVFQNYSKAGGYWFVKEKVVDKRNALPTSSKIAIALTSEEREMVDLVNTHQFDIDDYIKRRMELKQITWGDFGSSSNLPKGVPCHIFIRQAGNVIAIFRLEASGRQTEILKGEVSNYQHYPANSMMWVKD